MIGCLDYNSKLDIGTFYVDTEAELTKLPNLTKKGEAELLNMNEVALGSQAICQENGEVYFLTKNNEYEIPGE